ncbi:MAG: SPFH domain-containing protein [Saprospiraceae bacterium]|nr:SPFH domain-containing protein [Saprospiraceae bacterium]
MEEKTIKPINGYIMIIVVLLLLAAILYEALVVESAVWALVLFVIMMLVIKGFYLIYPNGSKVLTLFGAYRGTVKDNGLFWTNPFYMLKSISLRARNFDSERVKVNDKLGNPILISVILVWRVRDTFKAAFEVDLYESFVKVQSDAAVRKLASMFSYDNFDDDQKEITLRSGVQKVNDELERELTERLAIAGIEVMEARVGYLAYAPEIANAMLKRQQATAIVAARFKIVEGAVSMVEMALADLLEKQIVDLDEEKKASMVSNLMVILCSDKEATPVLNTGTLNA